MRGAWFFGLFMIFLGLASAARLNPAWKAGVQGAVFVGLGAAMIWLFTVRQGLWITATGIKVRNPIAAFEIPWEEIRAFRIGRRGIFPAVCIIDLVDGSSRSVLAISVSNWSLGKPDAPERQIVAELKELLEEQRGG